ncbi:hypothetical protein IQ252_06955 [Tychonema sp. LEGE 07203]|nr:hypothetical protein [Tychonema sp. LEGE 07203]
MTTSSYPKSLEALQGNDLIVTTSLMIIFQTPAIALFFGKIQNIPPPTE